KSKGNVYTLRDLTEKGYTAAAIRYLLLSAHYRHELNFTFDGLQNAQSAIRRALDFQDRVENTPTAEHAPETRLPELAQNALHNFQAALDEDLNMPEALAAFFTYIREANALLDQHTAIRPAEQRAALDAVERIDRVLGVLKLARAEARPDEELVRWVESRLAERQRARARRDFETADAIRDELAARGITVEDTPHGPRWKTTT